MTDAPDFEGELLSIEPELTGVILGVSTQVTHEMASTIVEGLTSKYPGVVFAVVPGVASVSFRYSLPEGVE